MDCNTLPGCSFASAVSSAASSDGRLRLMGWGTVPQVVLRRLRRTPADQGVGALEPPRYRLRRQVEGLEAETCGEPGEVTAAAPRQHLRLSVRQQSQTAGSPAQPSGRTPSIDKAKGRRPSALAALAAPCAATLPAVESRWVGDGIGSHGVDLHGAPRVPADRCEPCRSCRCVDPAASRSRMVGSHLELAWSATGELGENHRDHLERAVRRQDRAQTSRHHRRSRGGATVTAANPKSVARPRS